MNKSEEVCKLLGITPKHYDDCKLSVCPKEILEKNGKYYACTTDCPHAIDTVVYPSFKDPSNFVKLLYSLVEVTGVRITKEITTIGLGVGNNFKNALVDYLTQLSNGKGEYQKQYHKVKQQLQQIEWEY